MTRKDFQLIADVLRTERPDAADVDAFDRKPWDAGTYDEWCTVVMRMADALYPTNGRFDRERFYRACQFR